MTAPGVTVSIVNHESRDAVLAGLRRLDARRWQVVVVDNASTDGSVDAIRAAHPDVEVVARTTRGGYGANHNLALARARGRHVLFLNDDAEVTDEAVERLAAHLDASPRAAIAAPRVTTPEGRTSPTLWPHPTPLLDVLQALRLGRPLAARPDRPIGWAMGCALMVRRDVAERLGGFDEGFFMYSEEIDLCVRARDAGWRVEAVPDAVVVHEGQRSTGDSPERGVEMARSRRRYFEKHYGRAGRLVAKTAVSAQFAGLALAARLAGRPHAAFWHQAVLTWREPRGVRGLRELAAAHRPR